MLFQKLRDQYPALFGASFWVTIFILLLALLPLPFGSNRPWASNLYAVLSGLLMIAMLWQQHVSPAPRNLDAPRKRLTAAAVLVSLVAAWAFIQVAPWTPSSWHHPLWMDANQALGTSGGAISLNPGLFPESLLRFLSYIVTFLLAYTACQNAQNAQRLVRVLTIAGVAYALYGIMVESAGSDTILWYKKWAYEGFLTSTFVNKNSYAAYAGLGLLCTMAFLVQHFKNFAMKDDVLAHHSKSAAIFASLSIRDYAYLLLPVVFLAALALTGSRAGVASTILGCIAFAMAYAANKRWRVYQWITLLVVATLLFILFVGIGGEALLLRIDSRVITDDTAMRLTGYQLTLQAIQDNPWFGFGLGTFDLAFRLYRDASLPLWFHHAHNDYLEMIMDLGAPAAMMHFAALAIVISCSFSGIRARRRDGVYPALAIGATVLVATHAFVDFSLHIPAIAATYAALLGLGTAQSFSSRSVVQPVPEWQPIYPSSKKEQRKGSPKPAKASATNDGKRRRKKRR